MRKQSVRKRQQSKRARQAEVSLLVERTATELQGYREKPDREAFWRQQMDNRMREFSERGLPTPVVLLDFNRELWPNRCGSLGKRKARKREAHLAFLALLAKEEPECGRVFSNRELSKRIGVSRQTIAIWRSGQFLEGLVEEVNQQPNLGGAQLASQVEESWRLAAPPAAITQKDQVAKVEEVVLRIELSKRKHFKLRRLATRAHITVAEQMRRILDGQTEAVLTD
jgi:DNA-binding XRE family transcriptional regulator